MKRVYSKYDFKNYTMLKQVLSDLNLLDKNYLWLISDVEAYPTKKEYQEILENDYLLISTSELVKILENDDFQWIWAVFSAIPSTYKKEDILGFNLPCVQSIDDGMYDPHNDVPRVQHPYSAFEIYAVDSSYMFIISDDEELINRFKESYPLYIEE
ncbi:MAG: hypothetical protein IJW86_05835 [Clostridia bacterium]|nr:hypothetical protein [Clostridia bacterium]